MPLPCPVCKTPLHVDLQWLIQNPICQCPTCQSVMNFEVPEEMRKEVTEALGSIKKIKEEYSDIATFGENKQKLI